MHAMRKVFALSFVVAVATFCWAQSAAYLYSPSRPAKDQGISLIGWGSGTIAETDEAAYEGTSSIRVSTRNFFQGGIMNYSTPVNLAPAFQDSNNLLMLALRVADASMTLGGGAGGPAPSGAGSGAAGAGSNAGTLGGGDEGNGRGGGAPAATAAPAATGKMDTVRLIISTTDGKKSEVYLPLTTSTANSKGWIQVGVPLKTVTGFDRTNQNVSAIAVSANSPGSVYVGEVRILNDSTPIYGELLLSDLNIGTGTSVNLTASGSGGASILKYTWSVQGSEGPALVFEGQSIAQRFRKPGTFKVSCTISDVYGLKKPFTTNTVTIVVN